MKRKILSILSLIVVFSATVIIPASAVYSDFLPDEFEYLDEVFAQGGFSEDSNILQIPNVVRHSWFDYQPHPEGIDNELTTFIRRGIMSDDSYQYGMVVLVEDYYPIDSQRSRVLFYNGVEENYYGGIYRLAFVASGAEDSTRFYQPGEYNIVVAISKDNEGGKSDQWEYADLFYNDGELFFSVPFGARVLIYAELAPYSTDYHRALFAAVRLSSFDYSRTNFCTYENCESVLFDLAVVENKSYSRGHSNGYYHGYDIGKMEGNSEGYELGHSHGYTQGCTDGYASGKTDGISEGYSSGKTDGIAEGRQQLQKEGDSFFKSFADFFFSSKIDEKTGERIYSGIFGGILQAYLTVANGVSLFGISLHVVILTLLSLVVIGFVVKYILTLI